MIYKEIITKHEATVEYPEWTEVGAIVELSQGDMIDLHTMLGNIHNAPNYELYGEIDDTLRKYKK